MKILITGGAGFIGHNVVRLLEQEQHECLILDTQTDYGFIPKNELDYLINARLKRIQTKVHRVDIRSKEIEIVFASFKPEVVIHLASFPRQKVVTENPLLGSDVMVNGLINLLEVSKKHKINKFVYISSSMVYGDFDDYVKEDAQCHPIGQYGIMKYMGEKLVEDYTRQKYFDHIIIRPSAVYGEYDVEDRVISKFIIKALRGETLNVKGAKEVLDFSHVDDVAYGITKASISPMKNTIYNITKSSGKAYTLYGAAQLIIKMIGRGNSEICVRDMSFPKRGKLSIARAIKDFNYRPQIEIEDGFKRYIDWYIENPTLWKSDSTT
jgi:nucleoside-diphosphate-sugar epimerase